MVFSPRFSLLLCLLLKVADPIFKRNARSLADLSIAQVLVVLVNFGVLFILLKVDCSGIRQLNGEWTVLILAIPKANK